MEIMVPSESVGDAGVEERVWMSSSEESEDENLKMTWDPEWGLDFQIRTEPQTDEEKERLKEKGRRLLKRFKFTDVDHTYDEAEDNEDEKWDCKSVNAKKGIFHAQIAVNTRIIQEREVSPPHKPARRRLEGNGEETEDRKSGSCHPVVCEVCGAEVGVKGPGGYVFKGVLPSTS